MARKKPPAKKTEKVHRKKNWSKMIALPIFVGILTLLITVPLLKAQNTLGGATGFARGGNIDSTFNVIYPIYLAVMEVSQAMMVILPLAACMLMGKRYVKFSVEHIGHADMLVACLVFSIVFAIPYNMGVFAILVSYLMGLIGWMIGEWSAYAMRPGK